MFKERKKEEEKEEEDEAWQAGKSLRQNKATAYDLQMHTVTRSEPGKQFTGAKRESE